ncbi:hypothetical protein B5S28_g1848 [[Candida] boidinii]|nr:hypothetical protein B5S28_g1848 [[Candida] boidinii]OWB71511.1 hypothetical protein B5S31_g1200 [[Candida] boidinii]
MTASSQSAFDFNNFFSIPSLDGPNNVSAQKRTRDNDLLSSGFSETLDGFRFVSPSDDIFKTSGRRSATGRKKDSAKSGNVERDNGNSDSDDDDESEKDADQSPVSMEEIKRIFEQLGALFGFQRDSVSNMHEHYVTQLSSRAARSSYARAITSLHSDYIGGEHANYRKWYFGCQIEDDEEISKIYYETLAENKGNLFSFFTNKSNNSSSTIKRERKRVPQDEREQIEYAWKKRMNEYSYKDYINQVALYLLIWGEANNLRFLPECLCFIYKCAFDYYAHVQRNGIGLQLDIAEEYDFLNKIITPLYCFIRDQQFIKIEGKYVRNDKDHSKIITYDDINQAFWYKQGLNRIKLGENTKLLDFPIHVRYKKLHLVNWAEVFKKTYREKRSWWHICLNFNRIWVIHISMFWFYMSFNSQIVYTPNYIQLLNNGPTTQAILSAVSLAGSLSCLVNITATICEIFYVPMSWPGANHVFRRLFILILVLTLNLAPSIFILGVIPLTAVSKTGFILSIIQFCVSIATFAWFTIQPLGTMFEFKKKVRFQLYDPQKTFTASFPILQNRNFYLSIVMWLFVFLSKSLESYVFLILSMKDPITNLFDMNMSRCYGDFWMKNLLCKFQSHIILFLMYFIDLILFFLDTYLWYIIWNCVFSISGAATEGISMFAPWKNIFLKLPLRIYSKLIATTKNKLKYEPDMVIAQVWNSIIISMYREHLISIEQLYKLTYSILDYRKSDGKSLLRTPTFFLNQEDSKSSIDFLDSNSEVQRRVLFFAQSLSTPFETPVPIGKLPSFTVLIPHYSESIIIDLKQIIRQDPHSKINLLDYLKELYPQEWKNFVDESKRNSITISEDKMIEEDDLLLISKYLSPFEEDDALNNAKTQFPSRPDNDSSTASQNDEEFVKSKVDDIPLYCVGYKTSDKNQSLKTRVWVSLRTQTLYRTISGFMNYFTALEILKNIETKNTNKKQKKEEDTETLSEPEMKEFLDKKLRILLCMQRLESMSEDEKDDVKILVQKFPNIYISSLEKTANDNDPQSVVYYSTLYHGYTLEENYLGEMEFQLKRKYRIRLSGNPILGDGKSDNQNHSLIFYRGEYIQVIDANQDNYLEECFKIRSVLAEFDEINERPTGSSNIYLPSKSYTSTDPVAIVGAREYIFSANTGVLGDVAAGKEQTFGTLFARTLANIGGKLHYGHPDFLNGIFMTTRGGLSKAQKGLHLNEDIFAGMNALMRGGRIKHCDYYQCGKGRDLGFSSILNFTSKIGGGMGEQLLSREHYYLGTQLPTDRFLSFYYAHAGFHLNNLFIIISLHIFMLIIVNLGALNSQTINCEYSENDKITDVRYPIGCYHLKPALDWITRYILSIFICFFISFFPLTVHDAFEKGPKKAVKRLLSHLFCFSPLFEVFVCQIYSNALKTDVIIGNATYISTGRGFSITRVPFHMLYSTYSTISIYPGVRLMLLLYFGTLTVKRMSLIWFWITLVAMCMSPFFFNPHQFAWNQFFIDYGDFIRWMSRGNSKIKNNSWIDFVKRNRGQIVGYKRDKNYREIIANSKSEYVTLQSAPVSLVGSFIVEIINPLLEFLFVFTAYSFMNAQNGVRYPDKRINSILRLLIVSFLPLIINSIILFINLSISWIFGIFLRYLRKLPKYVAGICHGMSIIVYLVNFVLIYYLEGLDYQKAVLLVICTIFFQRLLFKLNLFLFISKENKDNKTENVNHNIAFWGGDWYTIGKSFNIKQIVREYNLKVMELSLFTNDFLLGHLLLYLMMPLLIIPKIDVIHTSMLFWINPITNSKKFRSILYSKSEVRARFKNSVKYAILFTINFVIFFSFLILPIIVSNNIEYIIEINNSINEFIPVDIINELGLVQPMFQDFNDTGKRAPKSILTTTPKLETWTSYWI